MASPNAQAAPSDVRRFALVIGNNRPESESAGLLRYADDDAVATQVLLSDAKVESLLFVAPDEATRGLHPGLVISGRPSWPEIERGFATLSARMNAAAATGSRTEFLFFYSGHGDVDAGEGYVVLEQQRLTRSMLFGLLSRSPATRNHVFVDACRSYFLVFDRGPGGRRTPYTGNWAEGFPAQLANTGFVLSTSSDRESHEWERYQGGILSHELRSALRGAADADLDGAVSYAELSAFLITANRAIQNPRFKPDFTVRPPGHNLERTILSYAAELGRLFFAPSNWGHFYLENSKGERVLDAHPAAGQALRLLAPSERPLFVRQNNERAEYVVRSPGNVEVAALSATTPEVASRGALSLAFQWMFSAPFGQQDVAELRAAQRARSELVTDRKPELSGARARATQVLGVTALASAAAGLTLSALAIQNSANASGSQTDLASSNHRTRNFNVASVPCYAVALSAGLAWAWLKWWPRSGVSVSAVASGARVGDGLLLGFSQRF